jgi:hypothetical protein
MPPKRKGKLKAPGRERLLKLVDSPLAFFALAILVSETILAALAARSEGLDRTILIVGMLAVLGSLIIIVGVLAFLRPESLFGKRPDSDLANVSGSFLAEVIVPIVLAGMRPFFLPSFLSG